MTGDVQKKLDVLSNEMMVNSLYNSHVCAVLVSEENEEPIIIEEALAGNKFIDFPPLYCNLTWYMCVFYRTILCCF